MYSEALNTRVAAQGAVDQGPGKAIAVNLGFVALSLVLGLVVAPAIYALSLTIPSGASIAELLQQPWLMANIWINGAANLAVMICAIRLDGRFDRRLASVLSRTLLLHGTLGFVLLVTRFPHSNQVMIMAAVASAVLGGMIAAIKTATVPRRIAVLGPWHPLAEQIRGPFDWFDAPPADIGVYDVLLTTSLTDLDAQWTKVISRAMLAGKPVRHLAEFVEEAHGIVSVEHFDLEQVPARSLTSYRLRKRLMDIALVVCALPVALILVLVASVAILVCMGRPVLFRQSRVGLGGKPFSILKLRTMQSSPAGSLSATQCIGDPRVTPLGRMLRRFRIDELPQLWNVLRGDMSIIGPRPEWTVLSQRYVEALPAYEYRHLVRPGISGWAQVRGGYAADLEETRTKVGYDLFYIKNLSFSLDMQILARTIWTVLTGFGAR